MNKYYLVVIIVLFLTACATYKPKYSDLAQTQNIETSKEVSHTFYLIGDAGLSPIGGMNPVLKAFKEKLQKADANSTAIFLGDNIYPAGFADKKKHPKEHFESKNYIDAQLHSLDGFKGNPIFIPGNHDWYSDGLKGLEREQKYIQEKLDSKKVFFPENGCPIKKIDINEEIVVIAVDTEWYLINWDKHPTINDDCEIKDREKFFEELEGLIKKNADKTTIIALHHPMFSYGTHGGQFSLKEQFYIGHDSKIPLPILGTLVNLLRKTTGASIEDLNNKKYRELRKRLVTLAQYSEKVIFTSGHEHTLQYIVEENTPQIISGGGAKDGATRLMNGSKFSTGSMGYAILKVFVDGSSQVSFYGIEGKEEEKHLFSTEVLPPNKQEKYGDYDTDFPANIAASIYTEDEVDRNKFFKSVWGERYRKYYGTKVNAPTVRLDTLYGGLVPVRKGGGHQSKSLRLKDKNGKQYVMRALRKSAELYLQAMAFKEQYIVGDFDDTYTESLLLDFYTGSHPYAPFTIGDLSDAVGIYHTNPVLYYVPKQDALKSFNLNFGDELYMIEEHVSDGHNDLKSFGNTKEIESTDDLLKKLRKDEKYSVDKKAYVRARLFDMMIGDWDRHTDQWRWAAFKSSEEIIYKPIPRDRDQVFSIMGDGAFMGFATRAIPGLRLMEGFAEEIRSVKGFNSSPKTFALDMVIMPETNLKLWEEQAVYIQQQITPKVIDDAFEKFPEEVRDETVKHIKKILLSRKDKLLNTAREYYGIVNRYSIVTGTDKDDYFEVTSIANGKKEVTVSRIKNGKKGKVIFNKIYDKEHTKEIWIYGLDDDDVFDVASTDNTIKIRLIGGQNNDIYKVKQGKGVHIYDFKSKKNTFDEAVKAKIHKTDDYETNTYQFDKIKNSTNQFIPSIGSNPDDGFKIGLTNIYTHNAFRQNPFTQQHTFNAAFYFATSGIDFGYKGEFANVLENWNLELVARLTSANFSINFFGLGNETINLDDDLGMNYNRVKTETKKIAPSLVWRGDLGAKFRVGISFEDVEVEETQDRYVNTFYVQNGEENRKDFFGVDMEYTYKNSDNEAFPTTGMATSLHMGYKTNVSGSGQSFGFVVPSVSFNYKLIPSGRLVIATKFKGHFNIGDGVEFYQGASIGGDNGLRGFRFQRFTGKKAYYQNTDIRYSFSKMRTGILPVSVGVYGGYDYGRVWLPNENSDTWHTSYGGGFFLNASDIMTAKVSFFDSSDGPRFSFGVGFGF